MARSTPLPAPAQLVLDGLDNLSLLPSHRVPDELRLSAETRRRGLAQIARLRADLEARRSMKAADQPSAA